MESFLKDNITDRKQKKEENEDYKVIMTVWVCKSL